MRSSLLLAFGVVGLAACTSSPSSSSSDGKPAFEITSTDLTIAPGEEVTKCFYFHTPNTTAVAIHKWVSDLAPGSHHMIFYQTLGSGTPPPDGTIDDCNGEGGGSSIPLPVYLTQIPHQEADFPDDDGTGFPLAQEIQPNTAGYFQMHYLNTTDQPLTAHVTLDGYALPEDKGFTHTDLFITYNADISIPPHAVNQVVTATCPSATQTAQLAQFGSYQFWSMSTHSHKQTVSADIKDGANTVVTTNDWEHPTVEQWNAPTFYTFSGGMTWECTYTNDGSNANNTVVDGPSAATNEMCMGGGYYFPAAGARGCFMSNGTCNCLL